MYEPGSFFKPHKDSEKAPGMFATLVVQLPCAEVQRGGGLVVSHTGSSKRFAVAEGNPVYRPAAFGFFADCVHDVERLEAGRRLVLIYNVVRCGGGLVPAPPGGAQHDRVVERLSVISSFCAGLGEEGFVLYPLEHEYSVASLAHDGGAALKGSDAAAWRLLSDPNSGFDVAAAEIKLTASGTGDGGRDDGWHYEPATMDWDEDVNITRTAAIQVALKGIAPSVLIGRRVEFATSQMAQSDEDFFGNRESPADKDANFTGNAGTEVEYQYQNMALVLFPSDPESTAQFCKPESGKLLDQAFKSWRNSKPGTLAHGGALELLKHSFAAGVARMEPGQAIGLLKSVPPEVAKGAVETILRTGTQMNARMILADPALLGLVGFEEAVKLICARPPRTDSQGEAGLLLALLALDSNPASATSAQLRPMMESAFARVLSSGADHTILGKVASRAVAAGIDREAMFKAACTGFSNALARNSSLPDAASSLATIARLAETKEELEKLAAAVFGQAPAKLVFLTSCGILRKTFSRFDVWTGLVRPALLRACLPGIPTFRGASLPSKGFWDLLDACKCDADAATFAAATCRQWAQADPGSAFEALGFGAWYGPALIGEVEAVVRQRNRVPMETVNRTIYAAEGMRQIGPARTQILDHLARAMKALEVHYPAVGPTPSGWTDLHGFARDVRGLPSDVASFLASDAAGAARTFLYKRKMDRDPVARRLKEAAPSVRVQEDKVGAKWTLALTKTLAAYQARVAKRNQWSSMMTRLRKLGAPTLEAAPPILIE
ncbi:hypothetical protein DFJ74DRAFT_248003 [Hyaloraphidium curvatum]|nr:hypothetical protein DFJ74DRAFT_248003 [Hyaloraphidium curvatum]